MKLLNNNNMENKIVGETEVFTFNGWKYVKDLNDDDLIATVDEDFNMSFGEFSLEKEDYDGELFFNRHLLQTPEYILCETNKGYSYKYIHQIYLSEYNLKTVVKYNFKENGNNDDYEKGYLNGLVYLHSIDDEGIIEIKRTNEEYIHSICGMNFVYEFSSEFLKIFPEKCFPTEKIINKNYSKEFFLAQTCAYVRGFFYAILDYYKEEMYLAMKEEEYSLIEWLSVLLEYNLVIDKDNYVRFGKNVIEINKISKQDEYVRYEGLIYSLKNLTGITLLRNNKKVIVGCVN